MIFIRSVIPAANNMPHPSKGSSLAARTAQAEAAAVAAAKAAAAGAAGATAQQQVAAEAGPVEVPWGAAWRGPLTVVHGHDAARGLQVHDHAVGVDTGCVNGGRLTAYLLPGKTLVSVDAKRKYRTLKKLKSRFD